VCEILSFSLNKETRKTKFAKREDKELRPTELGGKVQKCEDLSFVFWFKVGSVAGFCDEGNEDLSPVKEV
jgi:hypothetical protein